VGACSIPVRALVCSSLVLFAAACSGADSRSTAAFTADGQVIAMGGGEGGPSNACFSCHGLDGLGDGVSVPRLAGLDAGYLQKQLEDYADRLRDDATMYEAARWLDDDDRRAVAAWYAALPALSATSAATVQLSVPAIAAIGGAMLLAEPITPRLLLASAAILGGIALTIRKKG